MPLFPPPYGLVGDAPQPDARVLTLNPRDYRITGLLLRRIWRLVVPYWRERAHWFSWGILLLMVAIVPATSAMQFWLAKLSADVTNALVAKRVEVYTSLFWFVTAVGVAQLVVTQYLRYLDTLMQIHWRQWLTDWVLQRYLRARTYYDIALAEDLDNPDQRIQGDVGPFVGSVVGIPRTLLTNIASMVTGGLIVANVSDRLMVWVLAYTAVNIVVTLLIYAPLIRMNFELTLAQADLRYGILHVRDNAETVAFYRGEAHERHQINGRLTRAIEAERRRERYELHMGWIQMGMGQVWGLSPFFLIVPLFFEGKIEYGSIMMATMGASQMMMSLQSLATYIPSIANSAPSAVRLAQVVERFDEMDARAAQEQEHRIKATDSDCVAVHGLSLQTPGGEQQLVQDLDLVLRHGESLVIVGQTGVGKSSVLRALAGLWTRGSGRIEMPAREQCLFLPQRPYMILGNLRAQLLYPLGPRDIPEAELRAVLERVCLPNLIENCGGLDAVRDWSKVLSLGEQQRIGFARVLLSRPRFVFLDEATSAVDIATEARLYGLLKEQGVGYVSVGHRESLLAFHDRALELRTDRSWALRPGLARTPRLEALDELPGEGRSATVSARSPG